jgi:hypothetical protein
MTPRIHNLAKIVEVDGVGRDPETPQHDYVQRWWDLPPTQPFGRPRGIEGGRWRWSVAKEVEGGGQVEEGSWNCVFLSFPGASFI